MCRSALLFPRKAVWVLIPVKLDISSRQCLRATRAHREAACLLKHLHLLITILQQTQIMAVVPLRNHKVSGGWHQQDTRIRVRSHKHPLVVTPQPIRLPKIGKTRDYDENAFFLVFLICTRTASAEGSCPPGYLPTNAVDFIGCAPVFGPSYPSNAPPTPPDPGPRWESRWGAIAIDDAKGNFGAVDGLYDKRKARKAAIKLCRSNGGQKCNIAIEYSNQCGALAWGTDKYVAYRGPVADEVKRRGVESCSKITSNCQVYYVGCSFPVER